MTYPIVKVSFDRAYAWAIRKCEAKTNNSGFGKSSAIEAATIGQLGVMGATEYLGLALNEEIYPGDMGVDFDADSPVGQIKVKTRAGDRYDDLIVNEGSVMKSGWYVLAILSGYDGEPSSGVQLVRLLGCISARKFAANATPMNFGYGPRLVMKKETLHPVVMLKNTIELTRSS